MLADLEKRSIKQNTSVVGYVRVSTKNQAMYGTSLSAQKEEIRKFCRENKLVLKDIFVDEGLSGTSGNNFEKLYARESLFDMFDYIEDNEIPFVIVWETSRLWRDGDTQIVIKSKLKKINADIISIQRPTYSVLQSEDAYEQLINTILEALDNFERHKIVSRMKKGIRDRWNDGDMPTGKMPLGYKYSKSKNKVTIVDSEKKIVQSIFRMYSVGFSYEQIANKLTERGIKTKQGNDFKRGGIEKIIKNPFYTGIIRYKGEQKIGNHKPIIRKELLEHIERTRNEFLSRDRKEVEMRKNMVDFDEIIDL